MAKLCQEWRRGWERHQAAAVAVKAEMGEYGRERKQDKREKDGANDDDDVATSAKRLTIGSGKKHV